MLFDEVLPPEEVLWESELRVMPQVTITAATTSKVMTLVLRVPNTACRKPLDAGMLGGEGDWAAASSAPALACQEICSVSLSERPAPPGDFAEGVKVGEIHLVCSHQKY